MLISKQLGGSHLISVSINLGGKPAVYGAVMLNGVSNAIDSIWHHYALSREGGTFRLFIDGVLVDTKTNASAITFEGATIGNIASYEYKWTGYIDELRIIRGMALYTADFTPPTAPLTLL